MPLVPFAVHRRTFTLATFLQSQRHALRIPTIGPTTKQSLSSLMSPCFATSTFSTIAFVSHKHRRIPTASRPVVSQEYNRLVEPPPKSSPPTRTLSHIPKYK